jgi:hypothetical protein
VYICREYRFIAGVHGILFSLLYTFFLIERRGAETAEKNFKRGRRKKNKKLQQCSQLSSL